MTSTLLFSSGMLMLSSLNEDDDLLNKLDRPLARPEAECDLIRLVWFEVIMFEICSFDGGSSDDELLPLLSENETRALVGDTWTSSFLGGSFSTFATDGSSPPFFSETTFS